MNQHRHKIISGIFAIAFVVVVQWFAVPIPVFRFLIPAFIIYLGIVTLYNWRYLVSQKVFSYWLLARVPIFLLVWFGLLFVIPFGFIRSLFLLASLVIIFFFETLAANKGQQLAWSLFLVSLASLQLSLFGFSFYFPLHGLVYLLINFVGILLLVRASVDSVPHSINVKWLAGLVIGLFAAEVFWALQFLPLHFSVLAVISFMVLYLAWAIYYHYLYKTLTGKQIQLSVLLVLFLSALILLSSPWTIQG
jgi:hypothetical protein